MKHYLKSFVRWALMFNGLMWLGPTQAYAMPQPSAPRIECQISLRSWCIANFDGKIELADDGHRRVWTLQDRIYMKDGPLLIVEETKDCAASGTHKVRKLYERDKGSFLAIAYSLTAESGCFLEFRLPKKKGAVDRAYRDAMRFQVMINNLQVYRYE
jgi:hypothetical protein